jgi:hypothetical protein
MESHWTIDLLDSFLDTWWIWAITSAVVAIVNVLL